MSYYRYAVIVFALLYLMLAAVVIATMAGLVRETR